jgi:hypothetical protein
MIHAMATMRAAAQRLPLALAARVDKPSKKEAAGAGWNLWGKRAAAGVC